MEKECSAEKIAPSLLFMPLDLGSSASVELFVQTFRQRFDRLDGLVLSAGLNSAGASIQHADVFQARCI